MTLSEMYPIEITYFKHVYTEAILIVLQDISF